MNRWTRHLCTAKTETRITQITNQGAKRRAIKQGPLDLIITKNLVAEKRKWVGIRIDGKDREQQKQLK